MTSNRAVMSDADEDSSAAVREAQQSTQAVSRDLEQLRAVVKSMGYSAEEQLLDGFAKRFDEYRRIEDEILPLAVENTNAKAQRLSFGPAAAAVDEFRTVLDAAFNAAPPEARPRLELPAARAAEAILDIQVLHAPHIAEAEDEAMTRMEQRMASSEKQVRTALTRMQTLQPAASRPQLTAARSALDTFMKIHAEIIMLSRRNSDVRSLSLSLGQKRMVTAQCDDQLRALQEALAKHAVGATR